VLLTVAIPQVQTERTRHSLQTQGAVVVDELGDRCRQLGLAARGVALEASAANPQAAVEVAVQREYADYAALVGPGGAVLAQDGGPLPGSGGPAGLGSCAGGRAAGPVLAERVQVQGVRGADRAVAAVIVSRRLLAELVRDAQLDGDVLLTAGGRVVASTLDPAATRVVSRGVASGRGSAAVEDWLTEVSPPRPGVPYTVVVVQDRPRVDLGSALVVALLAGIAVTVAGLVVTVLARALTRPLAELTEAAERVARGDLETRIGRRGDGEVGRLSEAFDRMTVELRRNMSALEQSRGALRDSLERIGDTLMSTHDLDGLLDVVLETAVLTLQAKVGVVLYASSDKLRLVAEHGLHEAGLPAPSSVNPGVGVLGRVVSTGEAIRGRIGSGPPSLEPAAGEPADGDVLAEPVRSLGSVLGVIALYDRVDGRAFDAGAADALRTLAGQASIAVENVLLHQEAQRLSTTDALTGAWNFRYLSMSLAREIERSTRFDRPLAVLMLDLDHFKQVNDRYGHARGDTVLRELAHRVQEQIREVDTFARYGGEEFVVVLPETTVEGARQLAERICHAVRREPFEHDGEEALRVTVSIGGAAFPRHGSSPATLMRAADKALYVAKNEGRDRWHLPGD
jgi:diguanylate cyclase (GGDEF)-like protein